jgi:hypothetical protein
MPPTPAGLSGSNRLPMTPAFSWRPICLIECKLSDTEFSPALSHYQDRLRVPTAVQLVHAGGICRKTSRGRMAQWVISADQWLDMLP